MQEIYKYPRTQHIAGSGIQHGDEDLQVVSPGLLQGKYLVVEEKMDGANCAISFSDTGRLLLQSRGHYLSGGPREKQFHLFKTWAARYTQELWEALSDRYILYGEWLYAKHTVFYTDLPHYFMEFDILDTQDDTFMSTERRQEFLQQLPFVVSVKVLYEGKIKAIQDMTRLIEHSYFIDQDPATRLRARCQEYRLDSDQVLRETDTSGLMEGLYIKIEEDGIVQGRYKYVRANFLQSIIESESHWLERPLLPNCLREGTILF